METQKPSISPLRQRMIDDMRMRKFGEKTQLDYIRAVRNFTKYLGRSPDTATVEDLRKYQLHLVDHGVGRVQNFVWTDIWQETAALSGAIHARGQDEFASVLASCARMQGALRQLVGSLQNNAQISPV